MKDKFKVNFIIVLPAAIITGIILTFMTSGYSGAVGGNYSYDIVKVVPYLVVLIAAIFGLNVLVLLGGGVIFAGIVGMVSKSFDFYGFLSAVSQGMMGMEDLALIAMVVGGIVELIKFNGGIDFLLYFITSRIKSKKGAEFGIAILVSIIDLCTANNTIAIVMSGPLAKDIADQYDIDSRRSASILDIFSSCWQGIIPYGGQVLAAAGLASISPVAILPYLHYPVLMGMSGILAIVFGYPKLKDKTELIINTKILNN